MTFDEAFEILIGHEGGYSNHPSDPGGETKFGISKRSYPDLDIKNLTINEARKIYYQDYWQRMQLDRFPEAMRFQMFDAAVNHGPGNAARFLQRAVGAVDDGWIGPITLAAMEVFTPQQLVARFNGERLKFFTRLSTWSKFGRGWARRVAANLLQEAAA